MLGVITGRWRLPRRLGIGVLYQLLFALIIIWVRVQPIIVALSGFLALSGINLVILPRRAVWRQIGWGVGGSAPPSSRRSC